MVQICTTLGLQVENIQLPVGLYKPGLDYLLFQVNDR